MAKWTPDLDRLCYAMQRADHSLRFFRQERREMVREYVGAHWSEEGSDKAVPVNLLALYCSIVGRNLISKNPRALLSTFSRGQKPTAKAAEGWVNEELVRMGLANDLERVVLDALFSIGIGKVGLATPSESASLAWGVRAGMPFFKSIDLDDFLFDVHARDFEEVQFMGHRVRVPLDSVRDDPSYDRSRKQLVASDDPFYNWVGDERVNVLGRGFYEGDAQEFEDMVDLWEVYLPRHRTIVTIAADDVGRAEPKKSGLANKALKVQKWLGPDRGPYHLLGFFRVPGNAMPKAPLQDLFDLHLEVNELYRKLFRQADRLKTVTLVQGGADADGKRMLDADDGDMIRSDNPESIREVTNGGPNQLIFLLAQHLKDLFDFMGGGLSLMGGLAPQSKTATQDKMLNENSSHTITDMQDRGVEYTSGVMEALVWYWWHHPELVTRTEREVPGLAGASIQQRTFPARFQPQPGQNVMRRVGPLSSVRVDPYTLQRSTPQQRAQKLTAAFTQLVIPAMQLLQQQGIAVDMSKFLEYLGQYQDLPELADIVTIQEPPPQPGGSGGNSSTGPTQPETTRNYVRRSIGGDNQTARQGAMENTLAAAANADKNGAMH